MKNRHEKGFALILLLGIAAILALALTTAVVALGALRKQNTHAEKALSEHEKNVNIKR